MALAKLHGTHPVVHLLLSPCQTSPVRARCLHPDASGHLPLARVLPYRRAKHISDRLSDLRRRGMLIRFDGKSSRTISNKYKSSRLNFTLSGPQIQLLCDFFFGSLFQKACKHLNRNVAVKQTNKQTSFEESLSETVK